RVPGLPRSGRRRQPGPRLPGRRRAGSGLRRTPPARIPPGHHQPAGPPPVRHHGPDRRAAERPGDPGPGQLPAGPARAPRRRHAGGDGSGRDGRPGARRRPRTGRAGRTGRRGRRPGQLTRPAAAGPCAPVLTRLSLLLCLLALAPVAPAAAQAPVEGVDYVRIPGGHCDRFRPRLAQWTRRAGADVRVYHVPAAYQPDNAYARGYFALEALGRAAELHPRVFDAIHREATLPAHNASRAEIVAFLAGEGLDPAAVAAAMDAPATDEKMNAAYAFAVRSGIQGTPT